MNKLLLFLLLLSAGCFRVQTELEPQLSYTVQDRYLKQLPSAFPPLTLAEKTQAWSQEFQIGQGFAHDLDLYSAVTSFKRANYLNPPLERKEELYYDILFSYYLGKKYPEVLDTFEHGALRHVAPSFPTYHDLLVILYDTDLQLNQMEKGERILNHMQERYPETAEKLKLSGDLIKGNLEALEKNSNPDIQTLLTQYKASMKSVGTARALNALLPGAGYYYIGQKQSALTAFLLNGLFIWASVHFFQKGDLAAGIITTSFETGWYFGGIYGVGLEAKLYNERLYEQLATPLMNEKRLFPILMLNYAF